MTNHLIILAGGASSRMKKPSLSQLSEDLIYQANSRSKALILLNDRPMLDYVLYNAQQAGLQNIYIVIGKEGDLFKTYYGEERARNMFNGLSISYVFQHIPEGRKKPLGTAGSLSMLKKNMKLPIIITNGDIHTKVNFSELLDFHNRNKAFATVVVKQIEKMNSFGVVKTKGIIFKDFIEKPIEKININTGIYVLNPNIIKIIPKIFI